MLLAEQENTSTEKNAEHFSNGTIYHRDKIINASATTGYGPSIIKGFKSISAISGDDPGIEVEAFLAAMDEILMIFPFFCCLMILAARSRIKMSH